MKHLNRRPGWFIKPCSRSIPNQNTDACDRHVLVCEMDRRADLRRRAVMVGKPYFPPRRFADPRWGGRVRSRPARPVRH